MSRKHLSRLLTAALVLILLMTDAALLLPSGGIEKAHASLPAPNVILGLFRSYGALRRRNRVYREAGATAEEVNAYYDRLIAQTQSIRTGLISKAATGETHPRFVRSYVRIEAALAAERAAAIQMIEAEKNQARQEFNRTLGKEIANILIASPGGQQILGRARETIGGARQAAVAVQVATDAGRPIEALKDALAKQVGDIPIVQELARELGSVVGHKLDGALGGALSRVERTIDDIQGGMGEGIDLLDQLDAQVARYDEQERAPVSLVEDGTLARAIVPVDRATAAVDVAASAYAGAAEIAGALRSGTSRATMRDRIRSALLDERVAGIRDAVSGRAVGQTYCSAVGRGEYEVAAGQLGRTPQVASDPEKAVYLVCYDIQTQLPQHVRMLGSATEEAGDVRPPAEEEEASIPAGTYEGTTEDYAQGLGSIWRPVKYVANQVIIHVADDGTVTGSLSVSYIGEDFHNEVENCSGHYEIDVSGSFNGQLTGANGTMESIENWFFGVVTDCKITGGPAEEPVVRQLGIQVSGNHMTGATLPHPDDPDGIATWTFTAAKQ